MHYSLVPRYYMLLLTDLLPGAGPAQAIAVMSALPVKRY